MFILVIFSSCVIGAILLLAMVHSFASTRDTLHPLIFLCPLLAYSYVFKPVLLYSVGQLELYFPDSGSLLFVQAVNFAALAAFLLGCLKVSGTVAAKNLLGKSPLTLTPAARGALFRLGFVFGMAAVGAYAVGLVNVGGFFAAYGRSYGGGRVESGYLREAPLLAFPAIVFLLMAWKDQPKTMSRIALILLFAAPQLLQGILGARRGPTFLILAALLVSHYVISNRRPKLIWVFTSVFVLGALVLVLVANRERIYLGSEDRTFNTEGLRSRMITAEGTMGTGEDWSVGSGAILTAFHHQQHGWGKRFAVILLVRPIPKQIWPNKYEDLGVGWMETQADKFGCTDNEWFSAVGWAPPTGSAAGFIADLFLEFSFGAVFVCYGFGYLYGYFWKRAIVSSGVWALLYIFAIILSVYVPTQSTSAWLHRFLIMSVPTALLWRWLIEPKLRMRPRKVAAAFPEAPSPRRQSRPGGRPSIQPGEAT